jgi:hypothetical protein
MVRSGVINPTTGPIHSNQQVFISRLLNSVFYSIGTCFIMKMTMTDKFYRLLAIHGKKVLADMNYPTLRGARIAFRKKFKNRAWSDDVVSEWSYLYQPDRDWIDEMLSIVENAEYN